LPPIRLGDQKFKLFPGCVAERFKAGLPVNKATAGFTEPEGADGENSEN
jgi:hypothetical protein